MQIRLTRLSHERHHLAIRRADGTRDGATLETRSYLLHDLWHLAVESEAALETGFWGCLARGKTLAALNDRTGASLEAASADMALVEQIVGGLTSAGKGGDADEEGGARGRR